ncbi:VWA domain-containing protein [Proteiniborus sp. MB09-C3]|uniref:VWA domain-containing protein n=1 Tax=Proteiniborus sp. MB09-C3 TaxID=3050072 RepID=UPI0025545A86|nr:VWA domain-containing protein [Proteiniborus sp. MB09-C3]WIV11505.1 VWA domain-containing protein [Proteiniborus sp. MB09-C3]
MAINFSTPLALLLIPLMLAFFYYFRNALKSMNKEKSRTILAIRSTIAILLILALAGMNIKTYVDTTATIFAVDLSDSTRNSQEGFISFIEEALKNSTKKDKVGVITFGQNGEVELPLREGIKTVEFQTKPGTGLSNIEKGLKIAQTLLPSDSMKRIVLLTDGEENIGDSSKEAAFINQKDIDFKIYNIEKDISEDVQLNGISIPSRLYENQEFDIIIDICSNVKTKGKLRLYSDSELSGEKEINIEKGNNKFVFSDVAQGSGFKTYKAVISSVDDTVIQNNEYSTYTDIKGTPRVLLIDGESQQGRELNKLLMASGIDVRYIKDREVPRSLSELVPYSSIIMSDVSLENIEAEFLNSLKSYVRDYGGGLVVSGGENSFALGGYYKTPLEEILPVDMEMKVKGEVPSLGLMLVIDKSGSMESGQYGISKMEIAKEAAIKAVNSLKPKDKIGVIAFDGAAQWVVKLSPTDDEEKIKSSIGTIRAGGGTSILPALDEAYKALKDADTKLKHIILLTDGQAESTGYESVIQGINEAGITVSTVAVGADSDTSLLEWIANSGKGRYYFADEFSSIPQIFTKETFLASKSYINNKTFTPIIDSLHEMISPFADGIPSLDGYIGASSKDRATTILTSDVGDPILAEWQYGLGRTVAWTSDLNGGWSSDYLNTQQGTDFINNMIEWTFPRASSEKIAFESISNGDEEEIIVTDIGDFNEGVSTKATIITPNLESFDLELSPSKPGEYRGAFPVSDKGVYIVKINQYKDDEIVNTSNYAVTSNYSKEYDITATSNRLELLKNKSGGKFITNPSEVFTDDLNRVFGSRELYPIFLSIALLLFIFDIAIRRLNLGNIKLRREKDNANVITSKAKVQNIKVIGEKAGSKKRNTFNKSDLDIMTGLEKKEKQEAKEGKVTEKTVDQGLDMSRLLKAKDKKRK